MKKEIIIPFDGDFSQESREKLVKALEEQLEKLKSKNDSSENQIVDTYINSPKYNQASYTVQP